MISDVNKGIINITYNELNLPLVIEMKGNNRIEYEYDAMGTKKRQYEITNGKLFKTTDFVGNFVYVRNKPALHTFDEGRVIYEPDSTYFAETYIKDHLGNIRVAYGNDGVKDGIRQVNAYYPFGMNIQELSANSSSVVHRNEYLYNGKMMQDELGLDWLDYGFRFYDPQLCRWHVKDPLSEMHYDYTPYAYVFNNPIIDPIGLDSIYYNQKGEEVKRTTCDNDYFFVEHKDGNKTIGGGTYYQGLSRESFFGDRTGDGEIFETVDMSTMNSDKKIAETVNEHTKDGETVTGFLKESPEGKNYDYKNTVLGPQADNPIDNSNTAYMYKGILLNRNEAGNVYWGATTEKLGMPGAIVLLGVQGFSLLDEGKLDERGEQTAIFIGRLLYEKEKK